MSCAQTLLTEVRSRGVAIAATGDRITLSPRSRISDDLLEELKARKEELLSLLRGPTRNTRNGLTVLGDAHRERGLTLAHPWLGETVTSPKGSGRLGWTDGYRAAIEPRSNLALLVDLADVRLLEER